jgi:microcompartment protein CcmL/EutN
MGKKLPLAHSVQKDDFEVQKMKKQIAELEKHLKDAELKAMGFSMMVDIAEKEFKIPIRKNIDTKRQNV